MKWFRRQRGSQVEDLTPNYEVHVVPPNGDPAEFERIARAAFARRSRSEPKQSITVHCSCGGGMYSTALVAAKTVRMTCGKCSDTVDVTCEVAGDLAAQNKAPVIGSPYRVRLSRNARQVLTASLMRDEILAEEPDQVRGIVKDLLMDLQEAGLEIVASGDVE